MWNVHTCINVATTLLRTCTYTPNNYSPGDTLVRGGYKDK